MLCREQYPVLLHMCISCRMGALVSSICSYSRVPKGETIRNVSFVVITTYCLKFELQLLFPKDFLIDGKIRPLVRVSPSCSSQDL